MGSHDVVSHLSAEITPRDETRSCGPLLRVRLDLYRHYERHRIIAMNETDLCFTPATELVDAVRAKKLSAVEITTAVLKRAEALEPRLNAFAYLAAEEAMDAAVAADRALANGEPMGPLHGLPVTIKDHEAVRGMQIEVGTHLRRGDVSAADSGLGSLLRPAGAIILGKTATAEFGWMRVS